MPSERGTEHPSDAIEIGKFRLVSGKIARLFLVQN